MKEIRKRTIVLLVFACTVLSTCALAQTLDELKQPLLNKGQWDLVLDCKNFGHEYWSIHLDYGRMTYFDSQIVVFPKLTFGLAKNLQLTFSGTYQFPIEFSAPQFDEWSYWRETNTIRSLSAQLLFRPVPNMELSLFLLQGRAKNDVHFPRTLGIDTHYTKNISGSILILGGTWLSVLDIENHLIRADLDGLHGPLLKKGHWQIEPEILVRSHEYEYRSRYSTLPDYIDKNSTSTDVRLHLAASHGLSDHLQVRVDGYWQPQFRIRESSRVLIDWGDGTGYYQESETSSLYYGIGGVRGGLVWRLSRQMELNLAIEHNDLKTAYAESERRSEAVPAGKATVNYIPSVKYLIAQIDLGGTWLSKPKRPGVLLIADLQGIYQPLLGKKQFKLDGRICYRSYREIYISSDGWENTDLYCKMQVVYGFSNFMQATAYYGVRFFKNRDTLFKYEKNHSLGGELKWRLKKRAEIYASFNYNPWDYLDDYPPYLLAITGYLREHHDFLSNYFNEAFNIKMGIKLIF